MFGTPKKLFLLKNLNLKAMKCLFKVGFTFFYFLFPCWKIFLECRSISKHVLLLQCNKKPNLKSLHSKFIILSFLLLCNKHWGRKKEKKMWKWIEAGNCRIQRMHSESQINSKVKHSPTVFLEGFAIKCSTNLQSTF